MTVLRPADLQVEHAPADSCCGPSRLLWISEPARLTQFGAFIEELPPGSQSSIKHWHAEEDEMVHVLEGEVTLLEGASEMLLHPGDTAAFPAGQPIAHCLDNRSTATVRYLVIGTRSRTERVTYPDHDRVLTRDDAYGQATWTDLGGAPASNPYRT